MQVARRWSINFSSLLHKQQILDAFSGAISLRQKTFIMRIFPANTHFLKAWTHGCIDPLQADKHTHNEVYERKILEHWPYKKLTQYIIIIIRALSTDRSHFFRSNLTNSITPFLSENDFVSLALLLAYIGHIQTISNGIS